MAMSSKEKYDCNGIKAKDHKSVRFVDPPSRFDGECTSMGFEAPRRTSDSEFPRSLGESDLPEFESDLSGFESPKRINDPDHGSIRKLDDTCLAQTIRDPELYCVGRRSSVPENALHEGITKADGSLVLPILKKDKVGKYLGAGSDSSLASNPWNLSGNSGEDMIAPMIPQRYNSEDVSTDSSLDLSLDQVNISTRPQRRESNRDVFLRQFLRKT